MFSSLGYVRDIRYAVCKPFAVGDDPEVDGVRKSGACKQRQGGHFDGVLNGHSFNIMRLCIDELLFYAVFREDEIVCRKKRKNLLI